MQTKPSEFSGLTAELTFVMICSMGQFLFAIFLGDVLVNQIKLLEVINISTVSTPWVIGSFLLPSGISVVVFGSLADLTNPKLLMVILFSWLVVWNVVGTFSLKPSLSIVFFIVRAMQGLAVGAMQATSMSLLGRIYSPGMRKTRAFAAMSAMTPLGFGVGCLQGGALSNNPVWIFASNAIFCASFCILTIWALPLLPVSDPALSLKNFDYIGALCAAAACGLVICGLTQGVPSGWSPYSYVLLILGGILFVSFFVLEQRVARPLVDNRLWVTPGFVPLSVSFFLGYGSYVGGWLFYAVRFFLTIQNKTPLLAAIYLLPNVISGILASLLLAETLHRFPGHSVLAVGMVAFTMGPIFFLPQNSNTNYWALLMPGIALVTLGPDLAFAATSIFITSSVPRSFQGSAGSVLITIQNLSAAIVAAVGDSIGEKVSTGESYGLDLPAFRAIWWFSFTAALLGAIVCVIFVRIPKSKEHDHVQ